MLFGMFKEKEVIENTNFDTTKGDIVEDFNGVINNHSNDKDLIPLTSFAESHSEDINYQNIDLNNSQSIINSINDNNISPIPVMQSTSNINYQYGQPQNNNYQNMPINNQPTVNSNYIPQQSYDIYSNMNIQNLQQPMPQNIQNTASIQFGYQNIQPNQTISAVPNAVNINNQNQSFVNQPEIQANINNVDSNIQSIESNNIKQAIEMNTNNNDIPNSPVEILTELPEKGGRTNLTSALLSAPTPQTISIEPLLNTNIQQENNISQQNGMPLINSDEQPKLDTSNDNIVENISIDETTNNNGQFSDIKETINEEIKNESISSTISLIPNVENVQENDNAINKSAELPPLIDNTTPQINVNNIESNILEEQKQIESEAHQHEHKFIISDTIDVEPGFKICPKCGQKIRDDYRLCFVCGTYF